MEAEGGGDAEGTKIGVRVGASAVSVGGVNGVTLGVSKGRAVDVAVFGRGEEAAVYAPITTGVGVNIYGAWVGNVNGVGALPGNGWIIQPLHEDSKNRMRMKGVVRFIIPPRLHCTF